MTLLPPGSFAEPSPAVRRCEAMGLPVGTAAAGFFLEAA